MNVNNVKRAPRRIEVSYGSTLNIQLYGRDNLYPQRMRDLISSSHTGSACMERYQTFIGGAGLRDDGLANYICNRRGDTVNDVLRMMVGDLAMYHGFALHVNYNIFGDITEVTHVPFESCRLEEEQDDGAVVYINIHPDWTGRKTRRGKYLQVNRDTVKKIYTFNPHKEVVRAQMIKSGGIESYRGQILWFSMDGRWQYPRPIYDKVVTNLSTDEGLDNVMYRNVRNNFLVAGMLTHKKGAAVGYDDSGKPVFGDRDMTGISESLDIFQGDENACAIMDVTIEADEDKPEFTSFEAQNFDSKFEKTHNSVTKSIYVAFGQEVFYRIAEGSLGFSTDIVNEAFYYYSSYTAGQRKVISGALRKIFEHWYEDVCPSGDYDIKALNYLGDRER